MNAKRLMILGAWAALAAGPALASQPTEAQVRELMQVMNVSSQFAAMNGQMAEMMGQQLPCVPVDYWKGYIDKAGTEQLVTAMIPAYQHHFSAEEVAALIKFYKSPLGQKLVAQMPATLAEAAQSGQQWSRRRTADMFAELEKQGKLGADGRCPATGGDSSPAGQ
ncbi:DUF2059 domain-containing protein [Dyella flagellata]|uniref:DUF2059 domain-containing protein n=1 Tax=Dyella flagellata TaxID=1867833 RepID=A0ABQ5X5L3_9GAMM|nr:DUF2059 domain-containing protein [Dyella flagellata]GLQ86920.1 hypothetical protein GCM10007898_04860 [Dyella flagellata]